MKYPIALLLLAGTFLLVAIPDPTHAEEYDIFGTPGDLRDDFAPDAFNRFAAQAAEEGIWQKIHREFVQITGRDNPLVILQQDAYGYPLARFNNRVFGGDHAFMIKLASLLPADPRDRILGEALQDPQNVFANLGTAEQLLEEFMFRRGTPTMRQLVSENRARREGVDRSYRAWQENETSRNERAARHYEQQNRQTEAYHKSRRDLENDLGDQDMEQGHFEDAARHYESAQEHQELYGR